jgi:hypothetical protein
VVRRYVDQLKAAGSRFHVVLGALQNDRKVRKDEMHDIARGLGTPVGKGTGKEHAVDRMAQASAQPSHDYSPDVRYAIHQERRKAMGLPTKPGPWHHECNETIERIQNYERERGPKR